MVDRVTEIREALAQGMDGPASPIWEAAWAYADLLESGPTEAMIEAGSLTLGVWLLYVDLPKYLQSANAQRVIVRTVISAALAAVVPVEGE